MSSEIAIRLENVGKRYKLYSQPKDRLKQSILPKLQRLFLRPVQQYYNEFWALNDVSFDVPKGEALGIIGRNGSGKSTLLQIISGTLTPTVGKVNIEGRVAALLELGSGFNPEFTGRENIYMNAAILGLTKEHIDECYDDIISFASIGEHIDHPVKTYSSGMFARLAFAVAVNVNPDILIVDEVLSVGDMRFRQKCNRKMQEFREQGKTILLVSHDIQSVTAFCERAVWLDKGRIRENGNTRDVCQHYIDFMNYDNTIAYRSVTTLIKIDDEVAVQEMNFPWVDMAGCENFGDGGAQIVRAALIDAETELQPNFIRPGQLLRLTMQVETQRNIQGIIYGIRLKNKLGLIIFDINSGYYLKIDALKGIHTVTFNLKFPELTNGPYTFSLAVAEGSNQNHIPLHWIHDAICFNVYCSEKIYSVNSIIALPLSACSIQLKNESSIECK